MREIKFRAWDGTRKQQMVQVRQIYIPDGNNENGLQEIAISSLKFGTNPSRWLIAPSLMQSTGRRDKNGVEVYEGDVLNVFPEGDPLYVTIEWDEEWAAWCCRVSVNAKHMLRDIREPHVIAGNIYENPELLEEKCQNKLR